MATEELMFPPSLVLHSKVSGAATATAEKPTIDMAAIFFIHLDMTITLLIIIHPIALPLINRTIHFLITLYVF
jgi:hypothetical protein